MDHLVPGWVKETPIFFITICTSPRGLNQLCHPTKSTAILTAARYYHAQLRWHVHLLLLMPDHLHALVSFPRIESTQQVVSSWKHYLSKEHHIEWQRDYFDHRLRSDESHEEKAAYIRQKSRARRIGHFP